MNKKLLALAVSSALAGIGTAQADTANVNVYGKLYPQLQISEVSGDDPGEDVSSSTAVNSQNSAIGFRGDVDIGGGTKGWFQVEQSIAIDGGEGGEAFWSTRNSAVGLEGGFGNVFLGTWDTVYKQLGGPVGGLGLSSGNFISSSNILSRIGFIVNADGSSRVSRFHERPEGYIEYDSPEIGGFQFLVGYAPDEDRSGNLNTSLVSTGVKWESGPLYVALGYETHNDFLSLSQLELDANDDPIDPGTSSEDKAIRLSLAYEFGNTAIGFDFSTLEWEESGRAVATSFSRYEKDTWELSVEHKIGPWGLSASYVNSDEGSCSLVGGGACSTAGFGATQLNLAVMYSFNKRLGVFGLYSKLDNDENANHNNIDLDVAPGADTSAFAAGVQLRF